MESGLFKGCLNRDTYIELVNHSSFWFHPTYFDYLKTQGFMWNGYTWIAWGTDLNSIVSFQCV
ncbi:hypothetical protein [Psychrobacillus vulpis]|uniref:Uncharacterized protein n=1 Tax=Psychrobacillus vulpis TaxID=2325572 RepID=A0A544TS71_9BACI|nr:hypothetical protein [Psychrobacillus vulpis]TQR20292.1 hypothetical protein FG384_07565 [Psychrobacillus vulpis]